MGQHSKIRMQQQEGRTSRQMITGGGGETKNSRMNGTEKKMAKS
jgi:hypothetical protein